MGAIDPGTDLGRIGLPAAYVVLINLRRFYSFPLELL